MSSRKTFQQFIAENPHFCDVQGLREASDHGAYFRTALEKAWNAGHEAGVAANTGTNGRSAGPDRHADISDAASDYDKRLGATGTAVE